MKPILSFIFLIIFSIPITAQEIHTPKKISDNKIKIDGIISPSEWDGATEIILDNEIQPGYNIEPVVNTSGYILYSESHIFIRFKAETKEAVRASIRKRDDPGVFNDDVIGFDIDTYGDGRNNLFIGSNAYGSQVDVRAVSYTHLTLPTMS